MTARCVETTGEEEDCIPVTVSISVMGASSIEERHSSSHTGRWLVDDERVNNNALIVHCTDYVSTYMERPTMSSSLMPPQVSQTTPTSK